MKNEFAHPASIQETPRKASDSFLQSKSATMKLRHRLYDQSDVVDDEESARKGKTELTLNRDAFRGMTKNLHMTSQYADVLVSSTDMGTMVLERMATPHA